MYRFGDFTLEADEHCLRCARRVIYLRPKSFETLLFLVRHAGRVVSKEELFDDLWAGVVVGDGTLTHCIEEIRSALDDDAHHPRFIQTIPRIGYKFVAEVREDRPGLQESVGGIHVERTISWFRGKGSGRRTIAALMAGTGLLGMAVVYLLAVYPPHSGKEIRSLAVLPFSNLSNDPDQEYFADGLTEALTADLARVARLRVISRTSAMQYKSAKKPLRDIARELNVDAVVEGSVLRSGDRVRITAQLIDAEKDQHLWGEAYERDQRDIIALLRVMARTIAREVQVELTPQEHADLTGGAPVDPPAYEAYLKGRYHWNKRTSVEFQKAIAYFEQAISKAPGYAPAYAGLADCYNMLGDYDAVPPKEVFPKAIEAAGKALSIEQTLPEAHASLGYARMRFDWNWPEAESEFKRAIALDPNCASAHHWFGLLLTMQGRFDDARDEINQAKALDPLSLIIAANMGWSYYFARESGLAIKACQEVVSMDSGFCSAHIKLGWALEQSGRYSDAISEFRQSLDLVGDDPALLCLLAHAYALAGRMREARTTLERGSSESQKRFVSSYHVAIAHAALGDRRQAFAWLEMAYQERSPWLCWLRVDPKLDSLRTDRRFADLLRRVGLQE